MRAVVFGFGPLCSMDVTSIEHKGPNPNTLSCGFDSSVGRTLDSVLENCEIFYFPIEKSVFLSKMNCRNCYLLFKEK